MIMGVIKEKSKHTYSRIFLNKTTATFFIFSLVLCLAQAVIQSFLFSIDSEYQGILREIISAVDNSTLVQVSEIPSQFEVDSLQLRICTAIPIGTKRQQEYCTVILNTTSLGPPTDLQTLVMKQVIIDSSQRAATVIAADDSTSNVTPNCAQTLLFAYQNIRNFSNEDLTFIVLQFWLLITSVFAIINDSVPHLWTVLIMRALATAWSSYSLWRTQNFQVIFAKLYADPRTPCGIDFFSSVYFPERKAYEIPDLVLNIMGLSTACWLSWHLLRVYNAQAVRYVGAPEHINRINKFLLAVLSCLQLEAFILLAAMGLWVDVLMNTAIEHISGPTHTKIYLGGFITTLIVLIPWITVGWYSLRREMRRAILLFFLLAFCIIAGWSTMFYSLVYRWVFLQWPFLAGCSVTSFILIVSSTALAIICRLNFGKGLKQYLEAETALAKSGFAPEVFRHDEEKNVPLDLGMDDYKEPAFSPTSPSEKYEASTPDRLIQPLPSDRTVSRGADATNERQADAPGAPLRVPRLAERTARTSMRPLAKSAVKPGEAF